MYTFPIRSMFIIIAIVAAMKLICERSKFLSKRKLGGHWSQRNGKRVLWMGGRVFAVGPGINKLDPAGEYTKRDLGETGYSFCKSFLNCNFWSQSWLQKVKSSYCGWETKESRAWTPNLYGNKLVYPGFFESSCDQEYLAPVANDGFLDVIEEDVRHFYSGD